MVVENEIVREPPCFYCAHYVMWPYCLAFPDGIPMEIRNGDNGHRQSVDGDHGFQFEPLSAVQIVERGGPGSGHHGHRGRLGKVGGSEPGKGMPRAVSATEAKENIGLALLKWQDDNIEDIPKQMGKNVPEGMRYEPGRWLGLHSEGFGDIFREFAKNEDYPRWTDWSYIEEKLTRFEDDVKYERDRRWIFEGRLSEDDDARRHEMIRLWKNPPFQLSNRLKVAQRLNIALLERDETRTIIYIDQIRDIKNQELKTRGGPGSGHHGHRGRIGEVGGSEPGKGSPRADAPAAMIGQEPGAYAEHLKLTKTNIGKVIKWSTSRYNPYKKKQVVDWAYEILNDNRWELMWRRSAYTEEGELDRSYLRSVAGSDDIQIRDVESLGGDPRVEIKVKREVFSCGAYTPATAMAGADYLVDGEQGYIAVGYGTSLDEFKEEKRYWFETGVIERGGPGSGHHGHKGRPGEVGGSLPRGTAGGRVGVSGLDPIRLPADMEMSEAYKLMKKEVKGFRLMTLDKHTGERVILRDIYDALDRVAEKLRHLNHEEFYLYSMRGHDIHEVGSESEVELESDEIAIMNMLDRRYEYPDPVVSIHNHPPSYGGQSFPPSFSDLRLMIKYGHTELHVVVPDGRWVVLAKNREIPKNLIYTIETWWNDYADRHLYDYFKTYTRATVGTPRWNDYIKNNKDAAASYAQFASERMEAMSEQFSDDLEVQWRPLTSQE